MVVNQKIIINLLTTLLLTIALPLILGYLLKILSVNHFENILLYSAIAGAGGLLAMATALFVFIKLYANSNLNYFIRIGTALLIMATIYLEYHLPFMHSFEQTFKIDTNILSIIESFGFGIASLKFIYNYLQTEDINELIVAGHTLLFTIVGVLFLTSSLWDLTWWFAHMLQITAYISAFYFLYHTYIGEMNELTNSRQKIEEYLDIINTHVIISTTDIEGNLLDVSSAFCKISGYLKEEMIAKDYNILKNNHLSHKKRTLLWETIQSGNVWEGEIEYQSKDGKNYWLDVIITPKFNHDHQIIGFTAIKSDITDKKEIEILSITDTLTQLYNQGYFKTLIEREIKRARRDDKYLSFLILDVDCFKKYNDTYGHPKGDEVLQKIGEVLRMHTKRGSDFAFRLGGEEFGLLFSGLNVAQSHAFADKILKAIEALQMKHKENVASEYVTVSGGLVVQKGVEIEEKTSIYKLADTHLYEAKNSGKNRFC